MNILSYNPGHDGAVAHLQGAQLLTLVEVEKNSDFRHSGASVHDFLNILSELKEIPDVFCEDSWGCQLGLDQKAIDDLVQLAQARSEERKACHRCPTAVNCTGGCLAINYSTTGSALNPPELYCRTISTIPRAWHVAWADQETC